MKVILHFLLFCSCLPLAYSQDCDRVRLNSQFAVDAFMANYGQCTNISYLEINGRDISSLAPMSDMTEFRGQLAILNTMLDNLNGLNIGNELNGLYVQNNELINDISVLENLSTINGDLYVSNNHSLESMNGLSGLESVKVLAIYSNPLLQNLDGLSNINSAVNISITSNPQLEDCCGVIPIIQDLVNEDHRTIGNNAIGCSDFHDLMNTCGLPGCYVDRVVIRDQEDVDNFANVYGECGQIEVLELRGNSIVNLDSMYTLSAVRRLSINGTSLLDLNGLSFSHRTTSINISNNELLTDLSALNTIDSIYGSLTINNNDRLENVDDLAGLRFVEGLYINNNDNIQDLNGFSDLERNAGPISITYNESLSSCCGLSSIFEDRTGYGSVQISNNIDDCETLHITLNSCGLVGCYTDDVTLRTQEEVDNFKDNYGACVEISQLTIEGIDITTLDSLNEIESISRVDIINTSLTNINAIPISESTTNISIRSNDLLTDLESFRDVRKLESVNIIGNASLRNLDDLNVLQQIERLWISDNRRLENIDGLLALREFSSLTISNNSRLSECCAVVSSFDGSVADKNITVRNNDDGCRDLIDLLSNCDYEGCISDRIEITEQSQIDNFIEEFGNCTDLRSLYIYGSDVTDLSGLSVLESISSDINIQGTALTSLAGLDSVQFSGSVNVSNNNLLEDIEALVSLDEDLRYLIIENNPSLSMCCVLGTFLDEHPNASNFTIQNNAEGCNGIGDIGQSCDINICVAPDVLRITSQSDIDNFTTNYGNCTSFEELNITGSNITNFDGLAGIERITQSVSIWESSFESLVGLEHIDLSSITDLNVTGTSRLSSLDGLSLPETLENITIGALSDLTDLGNLRTVKYVSNFVIVDLPLVEDLQGFQNLSNVENLTINSLPQIIHLDELANLTETTNLEIVRNRNLKNIDGLGSISHIERLNITGNESLSDCCSVMPLFGSGSNYGFDIGGNAVGCNSREEIQNVCRLGDCDEGNIVLSNQEQVNSFFQDHPNCQNIISLTITGQDITNLDSLIYLEFVRESLTIERTSLIEIDGLIHVDLSNATKFHFADNPELVSLSDLRFGAQIDTLIVLNNRSITSIGTGGFTEYANYIQINRNESLVEIPFFSALIGGDQVSIFDNVNLNECCGLYEMIDRAEIGTLTLENNGDNCSSTQTIREQCGYCEHNDVLLVTQEQVDNFRIDYPACTEIHSLRIEGEGINNLDGLDYLESIQGIDLHIENTSLTDLDGLSHVMIHVGSLEIINNSLLESVHLDNLDDVFMGLVIANNSMLRDLDGLENLSRIDYVEIYENASLRNLDGLRGFSSTDFLSLADNPNLIDIEGLRNLDFYRIDLEVIRNRNLSVCCVLDGLFENEEHNSALYELEENAPGCNSREEILNNCGENACQLDELILNTQAEVDAFPETYPNCNSFRNLRIEGLDIIRLDSLYPIESVYGEFVLDQTNITSLDGLSLGERVDDFIIVDNQQLTSLRMLTNIRTIGGRAIIQNNDALLSLDGFAALESVTSLYIESNGLLENLEYLDNLRSISTLDIENNNALSDCCLLDGILATGIDLQFVNIQRNADGCTSLAEVSEVCDGVSCSVNSIRLTSQAEINAFPSTYPSCITPDSLWIEGEDITSLDSLYSIQNVTSFFQLFNTSVTTLDRITVGEQIDNYLIINNPALTDLSMATPLLYVSNGYILHRNHALTTLEDLTKLQTVGAFILDDNDLVTDLTGLRNLESADRIMIRENASLSDCCTLSALLENGAIERNDLDVQINAEGCIGYADVEENCNDTETNCPSRITLNSQAEVDDFVTTYPGCYSIDSLFLRGSDINNLEGLEHLEEVASMLLIDGIAMSNLEGLDNIDLSRIDAVSISANPFLSSLRGLNLPDRLERLEIVRNNDLIEINAVSKVIHLTTLIISNNNNLYDLEGLENLESIQDYLAISNNLSLRNLDELSGLTRADRLEIKSNAALSDIEGLVNIEGLSSLTITNNEMLSACCGVITLRNNGQSRINIDISDNAEGCQSDEEITELCTDSSPCEFIDLRFTSQEQIDEFPLNHSNCVDIRNVWVEGEDISSLNSLSFIERISGDVSIHNTSLVSLKGLNVNREIYSIHLFGNSELVDISAFNNVGVTEARIIITDNTSLENLDGLSDLTQTGDAISIYNNSALVSIDGLANLNSLEGFYVADNPVLSECCFIEQKIEEGVNTLDMTISGNAAGCESIEDMLSNCGEDNSTDDRMPCGDTRITLGSQQDVDNFELDYQCNEVAELIIMGSDILNLDGLAFLRTITESLEITRTNLIDIEGVSHIDMSSAIEVRVSGNDRLGSLQGLTVSDRMDRVVISENDLLVNIEILEPLRTYNYLEIYGNESLSTCCSLIEAVETGSRASLLISSNAAGCNTSTEVIEACSDQIDCTEIILNSQAEVDNFETLYPGCTSTDFLLIEGDDIVNLDGISSLLQVNVEIDILHTQLTDLSGLSSMNVSNVSALFIVNNDLLENLQGLEMVEDVSGEIFIQENDILNDLNGLNGLRSVLMLDVSINNALQSLSGLEDLEVLGSLHVSDNPQLTDISTIEGARDLSYAEIFNNRSLSDCCIVLPLLQGEDGFTFIENNASGCNTVEEVINSCGSGSVDCTEILLFSQDDVDNFPITFAGCTEIDILHLDGGDINDLSALASIEKVNIELYVGSTQLTDLNGLAGVEFDSLEIINIFDNDQLTSLNGVMFSSHVMEINIDENEVLEDLNGLALLESVENLGISFNNSLEGVQGLEGLIFIENLLITQNPQLNNLDDLSSVEQISFGDIFENASLSDCCILLPFVQGDNESVSVGDNNIGCNVVGEIRRACQDIEIVDCQNDKVVLTSQQEVDDFEANYGICNSVNVLEIKGQDIFNLEGLSNLAKVKEYVMISNTSLIDLNGLANVDFDSTQYIIVRRNNELMSMGGLRSGSHLKHIKVTDNPLLFDLSGFQYLVTSDYLSIENNNSLVDLQGLDNVKHIDRLSIVNNALLGSLTGLQDLESVQTLSAYFNPLLTNVDALSKLSSFDLMHINYNAMLSECCGLMLAIDNQEEGDYLRISDNLPGCNTIEEVVEECATEGLVSNSELGLQKIKAQEVIEMSNTEKPNVFGEEDRTQVEFIVVPNPFEDKIMITSYNETQTVNVKLYDIRGALIFSENLVSKEQSINTAELNAGIYLLRIEGAAYLKTIKMVKN